MLLRRIRTLGNIPKRWVDIVLAYVMAPIIFTIRVSFPQVIAILNSRQVVSRVREPVGFEICKRCGRGGLGWVDVFELLIGIGLCVIIVDIQLIIKVITMVVVIAT